MIENLIKMHSTVFPSTLIFLITVSISSSPPGVQVFVHDEAGFPCIREPSIVSTNSSILVAFAMCREYTSEACTPNNTIDSKFNISDLPNGYVCSKRSTDGGKTWSNLSFPFGKKYYSRVGASVYDSFNNRILFQSNVYDQTTNETVFQLSSNDGGITWSYPPLDVGRLFLKNGVGTNHLIGPGNGLQLKNGRILFIAHNEKGLNGTTKDYIWYSDDFGKTYTLSSTQLTGNEGTLVQLSNGSVVANMRYAQNNATVCNGQAHCRMIAMSNDNGTTFSKSYAEPQLIGPVCEGSLISTDDAIYFSNPNSTESRINLTVKKSIDNGKTWNEAYLVYNGKGAYSCLTRMKSTKSNNIGLLFETEEDNCNGASCQIRFITIPNDF
eukprot:364848_1